MRSTGKPKACLYYRGRGLGVMAADKLIYVSFQRVGGCKALVFIRAGGGTLMHMKKHRCTPEMRAHYGCPFGEAPSYWSTSNEEYVKFGRRLAGERKGVTLDRLLARYKHAWSVLYPKDPQAVPLTSNRLPVDFL